MSEPTEPNDTDAPEPTAPAAQAPTAAEAPTAQQQPVPPAAAPYGPGYPTPAPYPFVPVAKEPWFNPAKRTNILISAIVAGFVLLGGGIVIGLAAHHDRRDRGGFYGPVTVQPYGPGGGRQYMIPGYAGPGFPGNGHLKRLPAPGASSSVPASTGTS